MPPQSNLLSSDPQPLLSLRGITKRYGRVTANDHVRLDLYPGRIHALLGENGAGKSTLVSILYGLIQPDEGELRLNGKPLHLRHPQDALRQGIALVQQHFSLIQDFTVLENLMLGQEAVSVFGINRGKAIERYERLSKQYHLDLPFDARVSALPVGIQQRVEIIKALSRNPRVILFDEPTAALVSHEIQAFIHTLKQLRDEGIGVVFITHRIHEVEQCADEVTVLRQGKAVLHQSRPPFDRQDISKAMVGEIHTEEAYPLPQSGAAILQIHNLSVQGSPSLKNLSLQLHASEILGIAGIAGNGQDTLVQGLLGLNQPESGEILFRQTPIHTLSVRQRKAMGIALIPQDRWRQAMLPGLSIWENDLLHRSSVLKPFGFIRPSAWQQKTREIIEDYRIQAQSPRQPLSDLSGGHQQRTIIASELSSKPSVIIAYDPTRGLDIHAGRFVHQQLIHAVEKGAAVLLLSSELSELFLMCHRIAVLHQGSIAAVRPVQEWTSESLGYTMTGGNECN